MRSRHPIALPGCGRGGPDRHLWQQFKTRACDGTACGRSDDHRRRRRPGGNRRRRSATTAAASGSPRGVAPKNLLRFTDRYGGNSWRLVTAAARTKQKCPA
jgi:hypothetical protein